MIRFENLTKRFVVKGYVKTVMENVSLTIPSKTSVALLGRNGAGKSTLLKMIAGTVDPTSGEILSSGTISWPVGFAGSFHPDMTGAQNTKFLARVYGIDTQALTDFVEDFAELGDHFRQPFRSYSSGMKSRLAFGISMGIKFDTYLVDEVTAVGDAAFKKKASAMFQDRMADAGAVFVSHSMGHVREMCDVGIVIENGQLTYHEDIHEAIAHHESNMKLR
ncbi:ATPase (plasmid) [Dinoroseobacter shibae DFL 12 = DSM 16493]|jgi:capsular polysaccharide transport system ATP-binding protein|uniref:ATPase n=1 Tax=Dinoroseobacter shibae (strain DSM 16493 / NCIMB 14021 / DFL 12) TaxID=398580 RepID=A8LU82_DINSH|nr:ABC transporter ATP-binding protein [Dinoroseobacter shibae]ABV95799.1 ATPase [Dinoroseobacter shibae DFL 12 = DSM 16493]URF49112.1 ABC transporter ATP-binding protein [Dinoroseobacter shibae]URF53421.1 ABC transporter ATP-binding protein [Dinoroseobacter shibae]